MSKNSDLVSGPELARVLDLSLKSVVALAARGIITRASRGKYPYQASVAAYCAYLRKAVSNRPATTDERTRLLRARADAAEHALEQEREKYVNAAEADAEWTDIKRTIRAQLLVIPNRVAAKLPHLTEYDLGQLDRLVRDVLEETLDASKPTDAEGQR